MQTLNVADSGFLYIFKCIEYYSGGCFYLALYLAALVFLFRKGKVRDREIFIYPSVVLLLTVFNPLFPVAVNSLFDINKEYYRFLWITPVVILLSYTAVQIVMDNDFSKGKRTVMTIALTCLLMGLGVFVYADGYTPVSNIYKMPEEVLQISEMIHNHSKTEYPRALCDYNMNMEIRQYDASILLAVDRERYMNAVAGKISDEMLEQEGYYPEKLLAVLVMGKQLDHDKFREALDATNTEYIVLDHYSRMIYYMEQAGLEKVGETATRVVMHYDLKEPKNFELADYSEVWKEQKF